MNKITQKKELHKNIEKTHREHAENKKRHES